MEAGNVAFCFLFVFDPDSVDMCLRANGHERHFKVSFQEGLLPLHYLHGREDQDLPEDAERIRCQFRLPGSLYRRYGPALSGSAVL